MEKKHLNALEYYYAVSHLGGRRRYVIAPYEKRCRNDDGAVAFLFYYFPRDLNILFFWKHLPRFTK